MFRKTKHPSGNVESENQSADQKYNIMSSQHFTYHWITKCASSTTALTLPLNLTSFRYRPRNIQHVQIAICMHQS